MGWDNGTIQPKTRCNAAKKQKMKDFVSPHLVLYINDGTYWLHDLGNESKYLDKNQFEDMKENELLDDYSGLESGYWCIIYEKNK